VIEIGAGLGGLTALLLRRGHQVIAVERDRDLVPVLRELFAEQLSTGDLRILEMDAKELVLEQVFTSDRPRVLMGNLPYQITGPLLQNAIAAQAQIRRAVFLVQREVADRLAAAPGSKTYGGLSVFCQAAFAIERTLIVRRGAFYPQPNVDSAVVVLSPHAKPIAEETPAFRALVRAAFHERRKVLRNAWQSAGLCDRDTLIQLAARAQISLDARGETLSVVDFARMTQVVEEWQAGHATDKAEP
jgi:16S rRNA (adenine1518-N6/adenine1519-N6)-dimethyltransferase